MNDSPHVTVRMNGGESCEVCDRTHGLEEHHTSYSPERTMTVCSSCHRKIHDGSGDLQRYLPTH